MSAFKLIFIHGYTASSLADWYPDISANLKKLHVHFAIPDLPGGRRPHAKEWLNVIHPEVQKDHKPFVLVGHSLGTRAVLLYLEKYQPQNVKLVLLVAAFANRIENALRRNGEAYSDFFENKIDIKRIRPLSEKFIVIHSKDDSSIAYEQGVEIAKDLHAELLTCDGRDHFSEPENASYILDVIRKEVEI